jgi:hypothetical protein
MALASSGLRRYLLRTVLTIFPSITIERTVDDQAVPPVASAFLTVGLGVQFTSSRDKANTLYGASILGWKQDSWLLCEWPFHLGRPISCDPGTQVLLRYLHQGKMIGYSSEVLDAYMQPFPFLLLSFPLTLEVMPLRKCSRTPMNEPILIRHRNDGLPVRPSDVLTPIGGLVIDLSTAGCAILLQRPMEEFFPGTVLRVEFEIVGIGRVNNLAGLVRKVSMQGSDTLLGVEFQFDGKETIEYRGWGGSVRKALESFILRRHPFESS